MTLINVLYKKKNIVKNTFVRDLHQITSPMEKHCEIVEAKNKQH